MFSVSWPAEFLGILNWEPLPLAWHLDQIKTAEDSALLTMAEETIRSNLQARTAAAIHHHGELGHPPKPVFDLMLRHAGTEDGSLQGEKIYRTVADEFAATRPAFRWRHLMALARVIANEFDRPGAGVEEARLSSYPWDGFAICG